MDITGWYLAAYKRSIDGLQPGRNGIACRSNIGAPLQRLAYFGVLQGIAGGIKQGINASIGCVLYDVK